MHRLVAMMKPLCFFDGAERMGERLRGKAKATAAVSGAVSTQRVATLKRPILTIPIGLIEHASDMRLLDGRLRAQTLPTSTLDASKLMLKECTDGGSRFAEDTSIQAQQLSIFLRNVMICATMSPPYDYDAITLNLIKRASHRQWPNKRPVAVTIR
jgi:hypothetical protein